MSCEYSINAIYMATEGEGIYVGTPQVFVRFQGCSIGCLNCDSKDTWEFAKKPTANLQTVLAEIAKFPLQRVSITGGDPLHPIHALAVTELTHALKKKGYWVNLEASGTRIDDTLFDILDFISFDYKTPSTGVVTNVDLIERLAQHYPQKFQVKSVVADDVDFNYVLAAYNKIQHKQFTWCLTPVYNTGEEFPQERFIKIIELNQQNGAYFRVIGQQHKWIFGPNRKNI